MKCTRLYNRLKTSIIFTHFNFTLNSARKLSVPKAMADGVEYKKPKILCLHGFRSSGAILEKEVEIWPQPLLQKLDLVFMDGPYLAQGKSTLEGIFDPPFYEWFQSDEVDFVFFYFFLFFCSFYLQYDK